MSLSFAQRWRRRRARRGLRRRLFAWFGVAILAALAAGVVAHWTTSDRGIAGTYAATLRLAETRFARFWDEPVARELLARDIAEAHSASVELRDADGRRIGGVGTCSSFRHLPHLEVMRSGQKVGSVHLCRSGSREHGLRFWLTLGAVLVVLWGLAGILARRLLRPLEQLERTACALGEGNLGARVDLDPHAVGEVGRLARAFNDMASRLEAQREAERELLAAVSHEVRSPLGRMRVLLELGKSKGLDPERIERLEREVSEIDELVAQLLASARLDFGKPNRRLLSVGEFVTDLLERSEGSVPLEDDTAGGAFSFDPTLVGRALANLLANARTHGGGATSVRISCRAGQLHFEVRDEGPGFGDADTQALFEPFHRAHHGDRAGSALGLGLALVARVARAHGGTVCARDRANGGACVGFSVDAEDGDR